MGLRIQVWSYPDSLSVAPRRLRRDDNSDGCTVRCPFSRRKPNHSCGERAIPVPLEVKAGALSASVKPSSVQIGQLHGLWSSGSGCVSGGS